MKFNYKSFKGSSSAFHFFLVLTLSVSLSACEWGDQIESLVQPNPDDFAVLFSDTATVKLSTVITDSVMTGSSSRMLAGRYIDPYFGKVRTSTFIQPATQSSISMDQTAVYDSLILSLYYDGYTYGDTTKTVNLTVHKVLQDIMEKNSYYNTYTLPFEETPLGAAKIVPRPRTRRRLTIRLSDLLGKDIFQKAQNNLIPSNTEWLNLVKGIMIRGGASDDGAILGFRTDSAAIQMHYHISQVDGVRRDSIVVRNRAIFNRISTDRQGTALANLPDSKRVSYPTANTGNTAVIQAGAGLMMRIDIPYLRGLRNVKYTVSNRAYLRITPKRMSITDRLRAPARLYVYRVDRNNEYYLTSTGFPIPLSSLSLTQPIAISAPFTNDLITNKQYYEIDVSSYITELLSSETADVGALILRTSPFNSDGSTTFPAANTEFTKSFERLLVGDQQSDDPGVKLELYYTTVKVQ